MTPTSVKTRRKFDESFQRKAVQNWLASGKSAEVVAQELGLHASRQLICCSTPIGASNTPTPLTGAR